MPENKWITVSDGNGPDTLVVLVVDEEETERHAGVQMQDRVGKHRRHRDVVYLLRMHVLKHNTTLA